jgi:hypothetical protein
VNTVSHEVNSGFHALIVELFEFARKFHEQGMPSKNVPISHRVPLKDPNASHKFAEIKPVFTRQDVPKKRGSKAVEILLKFPSFVTCVQLLCRVPRRSSKRRG